MGFEQRFRQKEQDEKKIRLTETVQIAEDKKQQRQEKIISLKTKVAELKELSESWKNQFGVVQEKIGAFQQASQKVTDIFETHKGRHINEGTRDAFIQAARDGKYDGPDDDDKDEVTIYDEKRKEVKQVMAKRTDIATEEPPQTFVEIKNTIQKLLPADIAKGIDFSWKAKNPDNVGFTIERVVINMEEEIKSLVKEGVAERHADGTLTILPADENDIEALGEAEMKETILASVNKQIEDRHAEKFSAVETLEKDADEMIRLENKFGDFEALIARKIRELNYIVPINNLVRDLTSSESRIQVASDLKTIADEFVGAFSKKAIEDILGTKPKRFTENNKDKVIDVIDNFDEKFRDEIAAKTAEIGGDTDQTTLIKNLKNKLTEIKKDATTEVQELKKLPDEEKYLANPKAEAILAKWKNPDNYFFESKANVDAIANREKALAAATLDKEFLDREISKNKSQDTDATTYYTVNKYYDTVEKIAAAGAAVDTALGPRYRGKVVIKKEGNGPILSIPILNEERAALTIITDKQQQLDELRTDLSKYNTGVKGWAKSVANKFEKKIDIEKVKEQIKNLESETRNTNVQTEIKDIDATKTKILTTFNTFITAIPEDYFKKTEFTNMFFKEYKCPENESEKNLIRIGETMKDNPDLYKIITKEDVEIHKKISLQMEKQEKAEQALETARESLKSAQKEATDFEQKY